MQLDFFIPNCECLQFSLVTQSCPPLCDPKNHSTPGLPVHHQLPEFTQTQVHRVSDAIQPSHPLLSPSPPPVDHVSSELFTMTLPSWVALNGTAHSFIELCKPLCHDKAVVHEGGGFLLLSQHGACYLELESIY